MQNTGYFIDNKLFYPGDSYKNPGKEIDILALPIAGPWCKLPDALRYAIKLKPKKAFPVHDGSINKNGLPFFHRIPGLVLEKNGISFIPMLAGDEKEF